MAATEEPVAAAAELESFSPTTGEKLGSVPTVAPEAVQGVVDEVAAELPVEDPARGGGDGPDGGERRRAQAGAPDLPDRPANPARVRTRRGARGRAAGDPRRARGRRRAGRVERRQGALHRLGGRGARGRRGLCAPAEGLGARAGRQGP